MFDDKHLGIRGFLLIYFIYVTLCTIVLMAQLSANRINGILFMPVLALHIVMIVTMILKLRVFVKLTKFWLILVMIISLAGLAAGILHHGHSLIKISAFSICYNALWYAYFLKSDRVKDTFGR
jgi:hypothetical protein